MLKAVIFDRDGVLVDSEWANIAASKEAFRQLWIAISKEDEKEIIGKHPKDYIAYFHTKYGDFSNEKFAEIVAPLYYKLLDEANFIAPAVDLAHRIKDEILLALNTSAELKNTQTLLKRWHMEELFSVLTTAEDTKKRKPDPESYLLTAQKLGVDVSECIAIEDSEIGLRAAKTAGMKCIVIPNEYTKDQDFSQADLIVNSADEIDMEVLRQLTN